MKKKKKKRKLIPSENPEEQHQEGRSNEHGIRVKHINRSIAQKRDLLSPWLHSKRENERSRSQQQQHSRPPPPPPPPSSSSLSLSLSLSKLLRVFFFKEHEKNETALSLNQIIVCGRWVCELAFMAVRSNLCEI